MTHGLAVGRMLPHVVRFNAADPAAAAIYAQLATDAGWHPPDTPPEVAPSHLAAALTTLLESAGIPPELRACGIVSEDIPALATEAAAQWTAAFNPQPIDAAGFMALYAAAL
jgi:alcohol dehydrogenase